MQSQCEKLSRSLTCPTALNQWWDQRTKLWNSTSPTAEQPNLDASGCGGQGQERLVLSTLRLLLCWNYASSRQSRHFIQQRSALSLSPLVVCSTPSRSTAPLNTSLLWPGNFLRPFYLILNTLRTPWQIDFANKVFANYQVVWKITMDYIHILWLIYIFINAKHFA